MIVVDAFQGMECDRVLQANNLNETPSINTYTADSVLQCVVWEGQNQAVLFTPDVEWWTGPPEGPVQTGYDQGQVALSIIGGFTGPLNPAGEYYGLISETTAGITAPIIQFRLKILATPGSTSPTPPDLITYDYCQGQLTGLDLTDAQRDNLPYLIAAASQAVRRFCFSRNFDQRTYVELYDVALDGTVRLYQPPVQQVLRVQGQPSLALTISNTSSAVQFAQAYFSFTGTWEGYGPNSQTVTGLVLNSVSNGVQTSTPVLYTTNETISSLATAINLVGGGWSATVNSSLGAWPVTELDGGYIAQGCATGAQPNGVANFNILQDINGCSLDTQRQGFLYVGQQNWNSDAERWGPGGYEMFGNWGNGQCGRVKVTYTAGTTTIPPDVQYQCAQLVKWKLELGKQELMLKSEKAVDYAYELNMEMVAGMPKSVREGLSSFRIHYA